MELKAGVRACLNGMRMLSTDYRGKRVFVELIVEKS